MELKPLPKKITREIRRILTGCKTGKLQHYQGNYHRGTSHCIAGWKAVLDAAKDVPDIVKADFGRFSNEDSTPTILRQYEPLEPFFAADSINALWDYARAQWRLTSKEASRLFDGCASLDEQFALLEKLEAGERL
jgi:hypothetical protein